MTRDNFHAKVAFFLSLGFWVPLFNIGFCTVAIILGSIALKRHYQAPKYYGGAGYAITALVLSITSIFLTSVGFLIYFMQL